MAKKAVVAALVSGADQEIGVPVGGVFMGVVLGVEDAEAHVCRHLNLRMTREQGGALRRLRVGLMDAGARLRNGRPVCDNASACQWILEQVAGGKDQTAEGAEDR